MGRIKAASDMKDAHDAIKEADRIRGQVRQLTVQISQLATQYLTQMAKSEDPLDDAEFDKRINEAIAEAKQVADKMPAEQKALCVRVINGIFPQ